MAHGHLPDLVLGGCSAWPLPADETSAGVARAHLRAALTAARAPRELVEDVTLAASELVTHGLRHGIGGAAAPGRRVLELWAYYRITPESQFVFKVFDPKPEGSRPAKRDGTWAENGRGSRSSMPSRRGGAGTGRDPGWGRCRCRARRPGSACRAPGCARPHPRPLPWEAAVVLPAC